jgi:plasmid stabilization system protein ParE
MIWRFHPEAAEEFYKACIHYFEISTELARKFHSGIEDAIKKIVAGPKVWPVIEDDVRRFLVRRFPYGIYYLLVDEENVVYIVAVMHMRRQSGYWRDRLESVGGRDPRRAQTLKGELS